MSNPKPIINLNFNSNPDTSICINDSQQTVIGSDYIVPNCSFKSGNNNVNKNITETGVISFISTNKNNIFPIPTEEYRNIISNAEGFSISVVIRITQPNNTNGRIWSTRMYSGSQSVLGGYMKIISPTNGNNSEDHGKLEVGKAHRLGPKYKSNVRIDDGNFHTITLTTRQIEPNNFLGSLYIDDKLEVTDMALGNIFNAGNINIKFGGELHESVAANNGHYIDADFKRIMIWDKPLIQPVNIQLTDTIGVFADPYIKSIYGKTYKLPDRNAFYRLLDNKRDFIINCETWMLPKKLMQDMHKFTYEHMRQNLDLATNTEVDQWLADKNLNMVSNACFMKNMFIQNGKDQLIFDLEEFKIVGNLPKSFKVVQTGDSGELSKDFQTYDHQDYQEKLSLETYSSTYGKVVLNFYKYSNPQMRNGYSISTEKQITVENSRGALLGRQRAKSVTIKKLTTVKPINDFKKYGYIKIYREAYLRPDNVDSIEYKTLLN